MTLTALVTGAAAVLYLVCVGGALLAFRRLRRSVGDLRAEFLTRGRS